MTGKNKPKIHIVFDYDGTVSPDNMINGVIEKLGFRPDDFWGLLTTSSTSTPSKEYLSSLSQLIGASKQTMTNNDLKTLGAQINLHPGVIECISHLKRLCHAHKSTLDAYCITCGLTAMVSGSSIAPYFTQMWGCHLKESESGQATEISEVIEPIDKARILSTIHKTSGAGEPNPNSWTDVFYVGDGLTDIDAFELVTRSGGTAICVYDPLYPAPPVTAANFLADGIVSALYPADYRVSTPLFNALTRDITKVITNT